MASRKTKEQTDRRPPSLVVSRDEAVQRITTQLEQANTLLKSPIQSREQLEETRNANRSWREFTTELLRRLFDTEELAGEFSRQGISVVSLDITTLQQDAESLRSSIRTYLGRLKSILDRLPLYPEQLAEPQQIRVASPSPQELVERTARRFHTVARQLRQRHGERGTLCIEDEYDVQDLLHALLKLFFSDVRSEEWTPSYAGGSARMDFLLKAEQVVVEVKMTRQGLKDREIGNQLLEDIGRYRAHGDCRTLICFVYDPHGHINNPAGLERDLSRPVDGMRVQVIVAPQH